MQEDRSGARCSLRGKRFVVGRSVAATGHLRSVDVACRHNCTNSSACSGYVSNCATPGGMRNHGCLLRVYTCATGVKACWFSSVPGRSNAMFGRFNGSAHRRVSQRGQMRALRVCPLPRLNLQVRPVDPHHRQRRAAGAPLAHGAVANVEGERISEKLELDAATEAGAWVRSGHGVPAILQRWLEGCYASLARPGIVVARHAARAWATTSTDSAMNAISPVSTAADKNSAMVSSLSKYSAALNSRVAMVMARAPWSGGYFPDSADIFECDRIQTRSGNRPKRQ